MSESLQKLQNLLQKLFRADAAALDFGIYRIINYRRDQIQAFIDAELPTIVNNALDANTAVASELERITELENQVREFGDNLGEEMLDADGNLINETYRERPLIQQYLEEREQHGSPQTHDQRADAVFNHLWTFFSRYYDNGDFIPRRRYSRTERYTVPYNGEEIYLHWANRDQYYVKSGEHFSEYRFKVKDTVVIFDLRDVDIEKDNVKGTKRFFVPISGETIYSEENDEICIPFEYRPLTDEEKKRYSGKKQQDKIIDAAEPEITARLGKHYNVRSELAHQIDGVTRLKKHLDFYTRSNTADFFIHKDLKQFLNRELDVYMKNEVMPLSSFIFTDANLQEENLTKVNWIETAKLVHKIANQIIDFLSHIEEFQKRLWLKKKFVLSTDYCLTLDRVPEKFYSEIVKSTAQLEEWKRLFAIHEIDNNFIGTSYIEPPSVDFLKENRNLVLDTCHFNSDFKDRLLAHFADIDNETDGLLIHGENFQALNLLKEKYNESLKAIYIDPPYNTKGSAIVYKNNYKDSSWLSLLANRITVSQELLTKNGIFCAAIDDAEASNFRHLLQNTFSKETEQGIVAVCSNPGGRQTPTGFSPAHEYAMFFSMTKDAQISPIERTEEQLKSYNQIDSDGKHFKWMPLLKGTDATALRELRPRLFYPIFVRNDQIRIPRMEWNETKGEYDILESAHSDEIEVLPLRPKDGKEMRWRHKIQTLEKKLSLSEVVVRSDQNGNIKIQIKSYPKEEGIRPKTWWDKKAYSATSHGTTFLNNMLGDNDFSFPKSIYLVEDCLRVSSLGKNDTVLDYFAGSGTTAHAAINLNRQDGGKRKYILIEMGHHFDTALMPRVKKAIYAEKWKDAKPVSRESPLSHIIKYQRIESYEDALNNIEFTERENSLFEEPLLSYLLGSETRESQTFLDVAKLQNPFSYQLNIVKDMQRQTQNVDLPETFNYLLGLSVQTRQCLQDGDRRYLVYNGMVKQKSVVIIWRETAGWQQEDWERDYNFIEEQELTKEADEVYVNTDSIVPEAEPLDPLFKRLMFSQ